MQYRDILITFVFSRISSYKGVCLKRGFHCINVLSWLWLEVEATEPASLSTTVAVLVNNVNRTAQVCILWREES